MTDDAIRGFENELVEGGYYPTTEIIIARLLSLDKLDGHMKGVLGAVRDWVTRKIELGKVGKRMSCLCCKAPLEETTPIGGFIVMVRAADGGFSATHANALVGAVCGACDNEAKGNIDKIVAKAMPGAETQNLHPGSGKLQ